MLHDINPHVLHVLICIVGIVLCAAFIIRGAVLDWRAGRDVQSRIERTQQKRG